MTTSTTYTDENKKTSNKDKIRNVRYKNSTHLITILSPNNCNCHIWKTLVSVKKKSFQGPVINVKTASSSYLLKLCYKQKFCFKVIL